MTTIRDQLADVLHGEGIYCGDCDYESGECSECDRMLASVADAILAAGFRPPAREITDPDEADELPDGTVIVLAGEVVAQRFSGVGGVLGRWWQVLDGDAIDTADELMRLSDADSVTVVHVPTEEAGR